MPRRYRNYNKRYSRRRREEEESLFEMVVEGLASLFEWCVLGLWRLAFGRKPTAARPANAKRTPQPIAPPPLPRANRGNARGHFPQAPPLPSSLATYVPPGPRLPPLPKAPEDEPLPYEIKKCLLSRGERALWYPIYHAVRGRYRVFCKVRMADLVGAPQGNWKERKWFGKIGRYHVDFVICHPKSTRPLLVVEHDDRGHKRRRQRELDEFKDRVLAAAGLPIYRVPAAQAYDPLEIRQNIDRLIASSARARPPKTK